MNSRCTTKFDRVCLIRRVILGCVVLISWIIAHRYLGICHDSVFYAGQAIHRLAPSAFQNDLFFAFGSQDNYTVFSPAYAWAIERFGLLTASAILLLLAHLAWIGSVAWLLRSLLSGFWYWFGLILAFSMPRGYGSFGLLSYAEPFLTARSWAEPLALLAAGFAIRGHVVAGFGAWMAATAMHPIMALPAGLFVTVMAICPKHLIVVLLLSICAAGLQIGLRVEPFIGLGARMDDVWLQLAVSRTPFTFLQHWQPDEYFEPVLIALLLTLGLFCDIGTRRRIWFAGLCVWTSGLVLSAIPMVWPSELLIQMQAWRVLWFVKVLAIIAATSLLQEHWHRSTLNQVLLGALAVCALNVENPISLTASAILGMVFIAHNRAGLSLPVSPMVSRLAWATFALIALVKIYSVSELSQVSIDLFRPLALPATLADRTLLFAEQIAWFVGPALFFVSWWVIQRKPQFLTGQLSMTLAVLGVCVAFWSGTNPVQLVQQRIWSRGIPELSRWLKPEKLVYWDEGVRHLWFGLHRGNYASSMQLAGIVYSRKTAIEGKRRLDRLAKLGTSDAIFEWFPPLGGATKKPVALLGLVHVCHDPLLDYVILSQAFSEGHLASFSLVETASPVWHLYDCSILREVPDPYAEEGSLS